MKAHIVLLILVLVVGLTVMPAYPNEDSKGKTCVYDLENTQTALTKH